jgi:hypothetical protein
MLEPFSQRIGAVRKSTAFQKESTTLVLRTDLWNVWYARSWNHEDHDSNFAVGDEYLDMLWTQLLHAELNQLHNGGFGTALRIIHKEWFEGTWHFSYDVMDATLAYQASISDLDDFTQAVNDVLRCNLSAYHIVGSTLAPMTSDAEIESVETALATPNDAVQEHLSRALAHFSSRENPDYRNSIKESISAVESLCKRIAGKDKATLGDALKELKSAGVTVHPALEKAFEELYGYTSDKPGIRHALLGADDLKQEDAEYMLVTCSAFVNYLVVKADKVGIKL